MVKTKDIKYERFINDRYSKYYKNLAQYSLDVTEYYNCDKCGKVYFVGMKGSDEIGKNYVGFSCDQCSEIFAWFKRKI